MELHEELKKIINKEIDVLTLSDEYYIKLNNNKHYDQWFKVFEYDDDYYTLDLPEEVINNMLTFPELFTFSDEFISIYDENYDRIVGMSYAITNIVDIYKLDKIKLTKKIKDYVND